jgi:hypothetical protein
MYVNLSAPKCFIDRVGTQRDLYYGETTYLSSVKTGILTVPVTLGRSVHQALCNCHGLATSPMRCLTLFPRNEHC